MFEQIIQKNQSKIDLLNNKDKKILYESCPCCRGLGVMFMTRKKNSLIIHCSYNKSTYYEDKEYYKGK